MTRLHLAIFILLYMFTAIVSAEQAVVLRAGNTEFNIDSSTGQLKSAGNVLDNVCDNYEWFDAKSSILSSETKDEVKSVTSSDDKKTVTFVCFNKETGLTITKQYTAQDSPERLLKKVSFKGAKGFVRYEMDVRAQKQFRDGGYYHRAIWHSGEQPRVLCKDVRRNIDIDKPGVLIVNRNMGITLCVYVYAVDGQPCFPEEAGRFTKRSLTENGWRQSINIGVSPDSESSVTIGYELHKGNELDYHLDMSSRPEMQALRGPAPQAWGDSKIALEGGCDDGSLPRLAETAALANRLPWGKMLWTHWGWFGAYYGDYASRKEDAAPGTRDPADVAKMYEKIRAASPNIKIGCYILPGVVNKSSRFAKEHPEWLAINSDGKTYAFGAGDYANEPTLPYNLRKPGCLDYWKGRITGIMERIKPDYIYTDGGVGGGGDRLDYSDYSVPQPYDWYKLWQEFQNITQQHGGVYTCNGPAAIFNDGGYHECNWYPMYCNNWREMTDRLTYSRIYSRPGRMLGMAGFIWNGKIDHPATRLAVNWWFVQGLTPVFLDTKGENQVTAIRDTFSYIAAAYELRNRQVVQAHVKPEWENEENEVEVHAQKIPGGGLLSVLNHLGEASEYEIEADTAPMGLKRSQRLYVWVYDMLPPDKQGPALKGPAGLRQCFNTKLLETLPKTPARLTLKVSVPDELAQLIVLTASPALIREVNGQECPLWLPSTLGIETFGFVDMSSRKIHVSVRTKTSGKLMIVIPDNFDKTLSVVIRPAGCSPQGVADGDKPVTFTETVINGQRMAEVAFPAEDSEIVVKGGKDEN